jgi:glycine cleavage system T protein
MAPFAGYDMPISYPTGSLEEHHICRRSVGLFDIDHMGQLTVSGPDADAFVSHTVSAAVLDMKDWEARYSLLLDEKGLVLDDLFVYRLPAGVVGPSGSPEEARWWIVVNASNLEADLAWFRSRAKAWTASKDASKDPAKGVVRVEDRSEATYMIAVQGPRALDLLDLIAEPKGGHPASACPRFTAGEFVIAGTKILFGRTGYTGEDGGELFFPADRAIALWDHFLAEGGRLGIETKAIGLAARDSLRFEAGMPLHGHEISPSINALEAGFRWACDFSKPDFVGKAALEAIAVTGVSRKLVGIEISGGVPREGYEVLSPSGERIGACVAGMFCPTVKKYAANAFVTPAFAKVGTEVAVVCHGKPKAGFVVKRPLYLPAYRRKER